MKSPPSHPSRSGSRRGRSHRRRKSGRVRRSDDGGKRRDRPPQVTGSRKVRADSAAFRIRGLVTFAELAPSPVEETAGPETGNLGSTHGTFRERVNHGASPHLSELRRGFHGARRLAQQVRPLSKVLHGL